MCVTWWFWCWKWRHLLTSNILQFTWTGTPTDSIGKPPGHRKYVAKRGCAHHASHHSGSSAAPSERSEWSCCKRRAGGVQLTMPWQRNCQPWNGRFPPWKVVKHGEDIVRRVDEWNRSSTISIDCWLVDFNVTFVTSVNDSTWLNVRTGDGYPSWKVDCLC